MKKILTLVLVIIMLMTTFTACTTDVGSGNPSETPSSTPAPDASDDLPPEEESEEQIGNLDPSINLGGNEINIISRGHTNFKDEITVESSDGDPIQDSIFQRRLDVERILNCEIVDWPVNEASDGDYTVCKTLENALKGSDCPYDIMSASAYTAFGNTVKGLCHDLLSVENLDLSQRYWATYFNEEASIGNAQYFATGAISLSLRRFIWVTFFNKSLAESYGTEDLYQVVNEGRWTIDYQAKLIASMYDDRDEVGGASAGDLFGLVANPHICTDPYWASCEIQVLVKDPETNFFKIEPSVETIDSLLEKVNNLYYKSGGTFVVPPASGDTDQETIRQMFTGEQTTMATLRLLEVEAEDFRNMAVPYGILPIPRYDESQDAYYSHAHDQFIVYGIVSSVPSTKIDDMGAFLECMAIEGYKTVTPAYYEVALKGKYSKDEESWKMLDDIVNNLKINGGLLYTLELGDILQTMRNLIKNKDTTCAAKFSGRALGVIEKMLSDFQNEVEGIQ